MPKKDDWLLDSGEFDPTAKVETKQNSLSPEVQMTHPIADPLNQSLNEYDSIKTQIGIARLDSFDNQADQFIQILNDSPNKIHRNTLTAETLRIFSSIKMDDLGKILGYSFV